jgi:hypothetical protein
LDVNSEWECEKCSKKMISSDVESLLEKFTEDLSLITMLAEKSSFHKFFLLRGFSPLDFGCMSKIEKFLEKWEPKVHPNHFLLLDAKTLFASAHHSLLMLPRVDSISVGVRDQRLTLLEKFHDMAEYCLAIADVILPGSHFYRGKSIGIKRIEQEF